jgi:hypothetical protein
MAQPPPVQVLVRVVRAADLIREFALCSDRQAASWTVPGITVGAHWQVSLQAR